MLRMGFGLRIKKEAGDKTAPSLSSTSVSAVTDTTATLNFTSSEAGTYYYLVYAAAAGAPNAATIKAQGTAVAKGTGSALADANTASITGLTAETSYKTYLIVEDAALNASDVATVELLTEAPPVPDYQPWDNYPDSPVLTATYPYQVIFHNPAGYYELNCCTNKMYYEASSKKIYTAAGSNVKGYYSADGTAWNDNFTRTGVNYVTGTAFSTHPTFLEANNDVYTGASYTTIYFAKTT